MKKAILAASIAVSGLCLATPVAAKDWRACVVGACLQSSCGPNDGTVVVSMATNVADPAVGGTQGLLNILLGQIQMRNRQINGPPMMNCTESQPTREAADQLSHRIFSEMSKTFRDVTLRSPNDMINGYDSTPGSEDPEYNSN